MTAPQRQFVLDRHFALLAGLLSVLSALAYSLVSDIDFKSDDFMLLAQAASTGDFWSSAKQAFTEPFIGSWIVEFYRPLHALSYSIDWALFGVESARPFYMVNCLWFAAALWSGALLARRFVGPQAALVGTLLVAVSPWTVNDVAWIAGRVTLMCTVFMNLSWLAWFRYRESRQPWTLALAVSWCTFAILTREPAVFIPIFAFVIDVVDRRIDRKSILAWFVLGLPILLYAALRASILGTWTGAYERLRLLHGSKTRDWGTSIGSLDEHLIELFAPATEAGSFDAARVIMLAVVGSVVLIALWRVVRRPGRAEILFVIAAMQTVPLVIESGPVDPTSSQRWYFVNWALLTWLAHGLACIKKPWLFAGVVVVWSLLSLRVTIDYFGDYQKASRISRIVIRAVAEAPEDIVFVHGVLPFIGASPFFEAGLGQTGTPPFGTGSKAVYPLAYEARYLDISATTTTPIPLGLAAAGRRSTSLWIDVEGESANRLPNEVVRIATEDWKTKPKIEVIAPLAGEALGWDAPNIEVRIGNADIVVIHFVTPVVELHLQRRRDDPKYGDQFDDEKGIYREDIGPLLEYATVHPGGAGGEGFLWIALYGPEGRALPPRGMSEVIPVRSTVRQGIPPRR